MNIDMTNTSYQVCLLNVESILIVQLSVTLTNDLIQMQTYQQKSEEDELCSTILAQFEKLRLADADASTTESEDEQRNREQFLKELITQELRQSQSADHANSYTRDVEMEPQEVKLKRQNEIMQK